MFGKKTGRELHFWNPSFDKSSYYLPPRQKTKEEKLKDALWEVQYALERVAKAQAWAQLKKKEAIALAIEFGEDPALAEVRINKFLEEVEQ